MVTTRSKSRALALAAEAPQPIDEAVELSPTKEENQLSPP